MTSLINNYQDPKATYILQLIQESVRCYIILFNDNENVGRKISIFFFTYFITLMKINQMIRIDIYLLFFFVC